LYNREYKERMRMNTGENEEGERGKKRKDKYISKQEICLGRERIIYIVRRVKKRT